MADVKVMRGDTTPHERLEATMGRVSARQRVVVLTFETVEQAEAWDALSDDESLKAART